MKNKWETSKKLTWTIIIFYIIAYFSIQVFDMKYNKDFTAHLNYILPMAMMVLTYYFGKSLTENIKKNINTDKDLR